MPSFGAARQFGPNQIAVSSEAEIDLALVIDRSGSMAYGVYEKSTYLGDHGIMPAMAPPGWQFGMAAPPGSRWLDLVPAMQVLLVALNQSPQDEHVSLATYGSTASFEQSLSPQYSAIMPALNKTTVQMYNDSTNIGEGILEGLKTLQDSRTARPFAAKAMLVLTDGIHRTGLEPTIAARQAAIAGVTIYTVTFSEDADQERMKEVARIGAGEHMHASTGADLEALFRKITSVMPMLLTQ
jgi:Ca-activated chloride channel homolog